MLELLLSKEWMSGRDEILKRIRQDVEAGQGGRILLVPELISHDMERRLCHWAGDRACRYAEVLSFPRLSKRVQEYARCGNPECLDEGGRIVAMAAAARQLHSRLKAYAAVETKPEFLKQLVEAVDEFKRCCVTPKDLLWASSQCEGVFAQKLEELSLLMEAYDSLCQRGKRDPRDQMNWLLEQLEDCDFAQNHVVYIDGFPDFTRQHMAILEHLVINCPKVVISMNCDSLSTDSLSMEKAAQTASQIVRLAEINHVQYRCHGMPNQEHPLSPVRSGLFQGTVHSDRETVQRLDLYLTNSIYESCEGAVSRVLELVRAGCRYRDIGIVCTDISAYIETLNRVMRQCKVPSYQSGNDEVLTNCVMTTILSAMRYALGGYDRKDLLQYLKSILSPISMETADLLENYSFIWGISGSQWKTVWEFHPRGLGEKWHEADHALLSRLNDARNKLIEPLNALSRRFQNAKNVQQQTVALYRFLEEIDFAERMEKLAWKMDQEGDHRSSQILNQLWEIILSALEQLYDILGDTLWDTESFTRLFILLLDQYEVGTIPPVLDAVTVGPVNAMRCQEVKHLIILGAEEGKFPGYSGAKGVLTDQERVQLRALEIPLTGGSLEGLQAEFSEIYGVVCGAQESITLFAPSANPSYVFNRLSKQIKAAVAYVSDPQTMITSPMDAAVYLAKLGDRQAADMLGVKEMYQAICALRDHKLGSLSSDSVENLYGKELKLSASQIDLQAKCRLAYFLRYGMKAQERKEITVDPAEFGTFVHDVLENTCRDIQKMGGFHQISMEDTELLARTHAKTYAENRFSQLQSQRLQHMFQRNLLELDAIVRELWRELSVSEFEPEAFELRFGDQETIPAVSIPDTPIPASVRGAVDRVDVWRGSGNNYYRVVDYKTGIKDFDYCDVFNGLGLQMLLYLFALENGQAVLGDAPRPVGVQYFPARLPYLSADGKLEGEPLSKAWDSALKRKGLVLQDMAVLNAMQPAGSPQRLSVKIKDDVISGDVMDRSQMEQLRRHVFLTLQDMIQHIAHGDVTANPYTRGKDFSACSFCPYKKICHYACVTDRRNYATMNAAKFWEEIGRESSHG